VSAGNQICRLPAGWGLQPRKVRLAVRWPPGTRTTPRQSLTPGESGQISYKRSVEQNSARGGQSGVPLARARLEPATVAGLACASSTWHGSRSGWRTVGTPADRLRYSSRQPGSQRSLLAGDPPPGPASGPTAGSGVQLGLRLCAVLIGRPVVRGSTRPTAFRGRRGPRSTSARARWSGTWAYSRWRVAMLRLPKWAAHPRRLPGIRPRAGAVILVSNGSRIWLSFPSF